MDKKSAIHLIESTFNAKFSEEQFTVFAKNLLNDLEQGEKVKSYSGNYIWDDYKEHINSYKRIGKYIDPNGEALDVLIIQVESSAKLERARTTLRNFVIKHLDKFEKDYALVAFYSQEDEGVDWRFSFVKLEHQSYFDEEKGKVKNKKEFTPAKRYSFLVGEHEKAHTAKNQILPLLQNVVNNPTVEQLEDAFSIERVTDEFFEQYKDLYNSLYAHFENDEHTKTALEQANIENERFTKKLLGQIVFLYFLQKKGWLGVPRNEPWGKGKKNFIQELYIQSEQSGTNFFKDKLQFLFYEALAKERDNENSYYPKFDCRIPFLNGGLFEADYKWREANITIPSRLFRNQDKNKSGDIGTGVLDVFDRYNFTIKEDEPLDKEVAVDPEMLGKVFENMLPENERKGKGAFYTPREIVHYMCQESLIHYLENTLGDRVPNEDIEAFIRNGHLALENDIRVADKGESRTYKYQLPLSIRENAELIDQKLCDVRICDPAIGSGAFPVGLLHEIVTAMLILKPHFSLDYMKPKLDGFGFTMRENVNESRYVYRLKRHIIQESIYGVDIDASAIDIARLRLWLSLVVDEDDLDPIETLPNLDYKIVSGNSLIGLPSSAMRNLQVESELEKLKEQFYDLTDEVEKKKLRQQINSKIRELLDSAEQFAGFTIDFDFKLFFSEVWRDKGGFDIVIGNPPYVRQELFKDYKSSLKQGFSDIYDGRADLYTYFIKKGFDVLSSNGVISFITSNKFIVRGYGQKIRKLLSTQKTIKTIVNFGELPVFKASVDSLILISKNAIPTETDNLKYVQATNAEHIKNIHSLLSENGVIKANLELSTSWVFKDEYSMNLLKRLNHFKFKLGDLFEIFGGIKTGCDKAFIIDPEQRDELIKRHHSSKNLLKPWYRGRDIAKWFSKPDLFIIYIPQNEIDINDYPAIREHLSQFKSDLENRAANQKWFELQQPQKRFTELFESNKIIYSEIAKEMRALLDLGKAYGTMKMFFIPYNPTILAILNSQVFDWYARMNFSSLGDPWNGGRLEFKTIYMSKVPIPDDYKNVEEPFECIIKYLDGSLKTQDKSAFAFFEQLLDSMVFELYFPEAVRSNKKDVIRHLSGLVQLNSEMSEEERLATIQSEYQRLNRSSNPVRQAIETIDSVEEVRVIKKSLQ